MATLKMLPASNLSVHITSNYYSSEYDEILYFRKKVFMLIELESISSMYPS